MFLAMGVFFVLSGFFITEKSLVEKLMAPAVGFFGGIVGGGVLGWIVGGVGIAAMGTAVGIGTLGAVLIGGIVGAVIGGLGGTALSFAQFVLNPSAYNANLPAIVMLAVGTAILYFPLRWIFRKVPDFVGGFGRH